MERENTINPRQMNPRMWCFEEASGGDARLCIHRIHEGEREEGDLVW